MTDTTISVAIIIGFSALATIYLYKAIDQKEDRGASVCIFIINLMMAVTRVVMLITDQTFKP